VNVLRQVSVGGILAVGMTFVILTGGIDLAVGAVMALAGTPCAGLMASNGRAAVIMTGRLMSGRPDAGVGFELDAIAAVVPGGTAIAGGRGLILGILNNGLNLTGITPYLQDVIKGGIILLAIYIGRELR
jgi:ribose transport system permease protein